MALPPDGYPWSGIDGGNYELWRQLMEAQSEMARLAIRPMFIRRDGQFADPPIDAIEWQAQQAQEQIRRVIGIDYAAGADRTVITELEPPILEVVLNLTETQITAPMPGKTIKLPPRPPDPRLAAERLLRSILPDDLAVSLSALGEFEYQAKQFRYRLFKESKTHCFQGDRTFSCCIGLEDTQAPDSDRIVAEYLLLRNDEPQYLKTANLTEIRRAQSGTALAAREQQEWAQRHNRPPAYLEYRPQPGLPIPHVIRNGQTEHLRLVAYECFRMLFGAPPFVSQRFPDLTLERIAGIGERRVVSVDIDPWELERQPFDDVRERYLRPAVETLRSYLTPDQVTIMGFWPTERHGVDSYYTVHHEGKHLTFLRTFDIVRYAHLARIEVGIIVPR